MKFATLSAIAAATVLATVAAPAQAAILSVTGSGEIIGTPEDIGNIHSPTSNLNILGFDEQQGVTLTQDIAVDGGNMISSGTTVNSHLLFINQPANQSGTLHKKASWIFDGIILGVMSDFDATLEAASNNQLAADGTKYPGSVYARGLEENMGDKYSGIGTNTLEVDFRVTHPGDWVRVVTAAPKSVPEPASAMAMVGIGAGLFMKRRQNRA